MKTSHQVPPLVFVDKRGYQTARKDCKVSNVLTFGKYLLGAEQDQAKRMGMGIASHNAMTRSFGSVEYQKPLEPARLRTSTNQRRLSISTSP